MKTTKTTATTTSTATTTNCATCGKLVRIEGAMKTAEGTFYHAGCDAPPSAARDAKVQEINARKAAAPVAPAKPSKAPAKPVKSAPAAKTPAKGKKAVQAPAKPKATPSKASAVAGSIEGNPYEPASIIGQSFELARKGTTLAVIQALCERANIDTGRVRRHMLSGTWKGIVWAVDFNKETGKLKITPKVKHGKKIA